MVFYNSIIAKWLLLKGFQAVTIGPFIFIRRRKEEVNRRLINHERIHVTQWFETMLLSLWVLLLLVNPLGVPLWTLALTPIAFYVWYAVEYIIRRLFSNRDHREAYRNIVFEREAYENEWDLCYIRKHRMLYDFIWYYHYKSINRKEV